MKSEKTAQFDDLPVILVAEDDEDSRWLIVSELEGSYRVIEADNGKKALSMTLEQIPDLVVTDIMMPVMDGVELCRRVKEHPFTAHIPVVMLTAKSSVESQIEGFETGADAYITKPFSMELLKAQIQNLLVMRRQLRQRFSAQLSATESRASRQSPADAGVPGQPLFQNAMDQEFWTEILDVLNRRSAEVDFSIDSLADELGMSQRSLQRKIKAVSDRTPVQLIAEYRLKQAVRLLVDTSRAITDVAYESGFGDLSHFYRLFKKRFGRNPSQYREGK